MMMMIVYWYLFSNHYSIYSHRTPVPTPRTELRQGLDLLLAQLADEEANELIAVTCFLHMFSCFSYLCPCTYGLLF